MREDRFTNTEADAARYEEMRAETDAAADRPTLAELDGDEYDAENAALTAELVVAWDAHGHLLTQNDELRAALTRVEARCEHAEDTRRWLTAFEIRDALKPLYADPS